ncbi:hypothetical protein UFOVP449_104 [uncultured Caudovirales phage]|uniref:Uncharacterized protein n=1 Tax=uncultured Caudovirales phage TaxID=2100421 RepID=A0A6J5MA69_9CAUD|nr:hypothetical protein UFOVP449_104 [uncultured Caudovirales phage]
MAKLINLIPNITEAKTVDVSDLVKQIQNNTDRNDHTNAVLELAKFLKQKDETEILNSIMNIHDKLGSMPSGLSKLRGEILDQLLKTVKAKHGYDIYTQIKSAF